MLLNHQRREGRRRNFPLLKHTLRRVVNFPFPYLAQHSPPPRLSSERAWRNQKFSFFFFGRASASWTCRNDFQRGSKSCSKFYTIKCFPCALCCRWLIFASILFAHKSNHVEQEGSAKITEIDFSSFVGGLNKFSHENSFQSYLNIPWC